MSECITETEEIIKGPAGNLELKYYQAEARESRGLFVMCHPHPLYQGTMDNKVVTIAIKAFAELGFNTVRFNYRGVGKSEGVYGEGKGEAEDLLAVVDWATKNYTGPLYLGGFSFGCYVAYRGAGMLNPEQLLMIAPAIKHLNFEELPMPLMPWFVIQGDGDEVVSAEATYAFVEKSNTKNIKNIKLEKLPLVGHFFHGQLLTLKSLIKNYYAEESV